MEFIIAIAFNAVVGAIVATVVKALFDWIKRLLRPKPKFQLFSI